MNYLKKSFSVFYQSDDYKKHWEKTFKSERKKSMKVFRLRENAKLPRREHKTDAGADVFYCPTEEYKLNFCGCDEEKDIKIYKNCSAIIPTGIKVEVPEGYMLEVKNKGGIAAKRNLVVGSCVIDSGYDGEVFVNLHNIGEETRTIKPGEKIAQIVLIPITLCDFEEVFSEGEINEESSRGEGSLGSTGNM